MAIKRAFSGAPWEAKVGYCRAIRHDNHVWVTGTAPVAEDGSCFAPNDAYGQAMRCFEIIEQALSELGVSMKHVVRTRMFVTDISKWQEFGKAHAEFFAEHPPTTSMIGINTLIDPQMMIEIEAEAFVAEQETPS
ncbi:MAG: RidA family protein [Robiginitomaculum sp.]|nr:RidA family protein [Robiginitomaculum sp.]